MTFGARLARLRTERDLTQEELARAAGKSVGTLRGWEGGRRCPLASSIGPIARALGVSADELLGLDEPHPRPTQPPHPRRRRRRR